MNVTDSDITNANLRNVIQRGRIHRKSRTRLIQCGWERVF